MNILVPIQNSNDIRVLLNEGANEFYCGYIPRWWNERFGNEDIISNYGSMPCALNNRPALKSNISSVSEFEQCVCLTKASNTKLFVTLNAKYYPQCAYPYLNRYIEELIDFGVTRLIVADLGLIHFLNIHYPSLLITVSCLSQITNEKSVEYLLKKYSVERIVFPRHLSVQEIKNVVVKHPNLEYEVFGLSNRCQYDDGFCRGVHDFYPFCKDLWANEYYAITGENSNVEIEELIKAESKFSGWARQRRRADNKYMYQWSGVACSLCSIYDLNKCPGNMTVKLVGRGYDIEERKAQIQLTRNIYDMVQNGCSIELVREKVASFFEDSCFCNGMTNCIMRGES